MMRNTISVTRHKGHGKVGIRLVVDAQKRLTLAGVTPGSLFDGTALEPGMRILSINGIDTTYDVSAKEASEVIQSIAGDITVQAAWLEDMHEENALGTTTPIPFPVAPPARYDIQASQNDEDRSNGREMSEYHGNVSSQQYAVYGNEVVLVDRNTTDYKRGLVQDPSQDPSLSLDVTQSCTTERDEEEFDLRPQAIEPVPIPAATTPIAEAVPIANDDDAQAGNNQALPSIRYNADGTMATNDPNSTYNNDANNTNDNGGDPDDQNNNSMSLESLQGVGWIKGWLRDGHIKHTILYIALMLYLFIELFTIGRGNGFALVGFILLYLVFVAEFIWCSSTRKYLNNIHETESTIEFTQRLYRTPPTFSFHMECYHYETRTRVVYSTDSQGRSTSRTETYTVKVTTWTGSQSVKLASWRDMSVPVQYADIEEYEITKVRLSKTYHAGERFQAQQGDFIRANRHRDVNYNFWVKYDIAGFVGHVLTFVDLQQRPEYLSHNWFVVSHLTVVPALPYRIWVGSITGKIKLVVQKFVEADY